MSLLGSIFGNPAGGILDDKAERMFAKKLGNAAIIAAAGFAIGFIIVAVRCG